MIPISYPYPYTYQYIISIFAKINVLSRSIFKWSSCMGRKELPNRPHKCSARAEPPAGYHIKPHQKMPKVKTNSSAKKRFKITGTGEITFQKAFKRHILTKKTKKRKRLMAKKGEVSHANLDFVKRLLRLK
jgi:large subunit ribosomal protein L35